jgi:hypothetical protein
MLWAAAFAITYFVVHFAMTRCSTAAFPVDCCITIHDQPEFQRRLDAALYAQFPDWNGFSRRDEYFLPDADMSPERRSTSCS